MLRAEGVAVINEEGGVEEATHIKRFAENDVQI